MHSVDNMEELLDGLAHRMDRAANMDWWVVAV